MSNIGNANIHDRKSSAVQTTILPYIKDKIMEYVSVPCIICGEIAEHNLNLFYVCKKCRKAILWAREKMNKEERM